MKLLKCITITLLFITLYSCDNVSEQTAPVQEEELNVYRCPMDCENGKTYNQKKSCPVCKMDLTIVKEKVLDDKITDASIFNLTSEWNTEEGLKIQLKELKGKTLVMVMIYTSCQAACPRLVADMRNIEKQVPEENKKNIQYVLISIDPETDTPEVLKEFAIENFMDGDQWTFLQGTTSSVRELANVLAVKYKEITPIDFSHSNIISVFNAKGELEHQQEGLGVDNNETIAKIIALSGD